MTDYKELVKKTAEKFGFNLEFRTKKVFEENHYLVDLNLPLSNGIEVDVKASKSQHMQILAECKGADPSSCLILVKETPGKFYNTKRHIISYTEYSIAQYKPDAESEFFTFTGDFFKLNNNKELKPSAFSDDNSNFYKAQNQVIEALNGISRRESSLNRLKETLDEYNKENTPSSRCFLIPIIVTNANIWVVDYTMDEVAVEQHKWVLQKAKINDLISLENQNGVRPYTISIPIVNIAYLDQFVKYIERMIVGEGEINIGKSLIDEGH